MKRRDFIRQATCGAMGTGTLLSTLTSLGAVNGALKKGQFAPPEDYKAIVCILLAGGVDSFNVLVPRGTTSGGDNGYNDYLATRTDLAIPSQSDLLALNDPQIFGFRGRQSPYQSFGVHPGMSGVRELYNDSKLAFLANVGTLVEPVADKTAYQNSATKLPLGIYSHSDQIMQWQTSVPQSRDALGVGGRIADLMNASNANDEISMNLSFAGRNIFQRGQNISEYSLRNNLNANNIGLESVPTGWHNAGLVNELRNSAIDNMASEVYANVLKNTLGRTSKSSIAAFELLSQALQKVPNIPTTGHTYPLNSNLGRDLEAISKMISVRKELGAKRQIFFVTIGGWDMHDNLVSGLAGKLPEVSQSLRTFYEATKTLGVENNVTTYTISDFARTVTSNGQGSDHAWGGNMMVMGGSVNGKKIYGAYPNMSLVNNPHNISFRGNFIPAVSTDEMYAELALWYGVDPGQLGYVLPNLSNFYSYSPTNKPVGFMNY